MKIFLIIFLTSIAVVILMFLLNAASFDGLTKSKMTKNIDQNIDQQNKK